MNKNTLYFFVLLILWGLFGNCQVRQASSVIPDDTRQLLLVITPHWDSTQGKIYRYERTASHWEKIGEGWPVTVGKSGLAWGRGLLETYKKRKGKAKKEGDGRSPAGLFPLLNAFGYASPKDVTGLIFPYTQVDAFTQCIEDQASAYYNQMVDNRHQVPDWNSTDHMLRKDSLYAWGVFVGHNTDPAQPGAGSCIFLHGWRGPDRPTAGCTAMPLDRVRAIVFWLDAKKNPLLIQLPAGEYMRLHKRLGLPAQAE